uniref:Uncharacterized protein n=1 Tax=Ditylenchus dipsaci TaxID=166011 RepID=A0A915CSZ4_9BILA
MVDDEEHSSRTSSPDSASSEKINEEPETASSPQRSDPIFTREELDHIERIRRLAEESSFEQVKYDLPTPVVQEETSKYASSSYSQEQTNPLSIWGFNSALFFSNIP